MRHLLFLLLVGILFSGCVGPSSNSDSSIQNPIGVEEDRMRGNTVQFESDDGITLVGTYWKQESTDKPTIVLVHQLGRDRHSFDSFARELFADGYSVLSFDLRGHGESIRKGGTTVYHSDFKDGDYQLMPSDIWSAKRFLNVEKIMVVGASIGANAALVYASEDTSSPGVVLLSPGLNYRGLSISEAAKQKRVAMLVVVSRDDTYSASSSQSLFASGPLLDKKLIGLEEAGHGTDMFLRAPELSQTVRTWINEHSGV